MKEVNEAGLLLGICTTSNERAAQAVVNGMLNDIKFEFVLAGDIVSRKKPDPETRPPTSTLRARIFQTPI
jgi:phosphoglycolate phosphatase-like HAD superfamily hydrolase